MSSDEKFKDLFLLVMSVLIGISFGIFLLTRYIAGQTQEVYVVQDAAYQEQVLARIAPVGKVAIEGEATTDAESADSVPEPEPAKVALSGPQVYNSACLACHGAGIGGAPKTGDKSAWAERIGQGSAVLTDHVINGYQGSAGYMPPKGGRVDLSDEEILAALKYMLDQAS